MGYDAQKAFSRLVFGTAILVLLWAIFDAVFGRTATAAAPPSKIVLSARQVSFHGDPTPAIRSTELSEVDRYARARGYRDWNHYLEHRPSNKMGEREDEAPLPAPPLDPVVVDQRSPVTFPADDPVVVAIPAVLDPGDIDRLADNEDVYPHVWLPRYIGGGGGRSYTRCRDCCPQDNDTCPTPPVATVPEPSSLPLMLAGAIASLAVRRFT